jgi:hypothetical protein
MLVRPGAKDGLVAPVWPDLAQVGPEAPNTLGNERTGLFGARNVGLVGGMSVGGEAHKGAGECGGGGALERHNSKGNGLRFLPSGELDMAACHARPSSVILSLRMNGV